MDTRLTFLSRNERFGIWRVGKMFELPSIRYYDDSQCWCFEATVFHKNLYIRVDRRTR